MITIDASQGEGGGQILRSALSLSAVTGHPVTLDGIRAGRSKPGLKRQHLTCVRAAAMICDAKTVGAEMNSQALVFTPGPIKAGDYDIAVGTAGSVVLVAQTVLPILSRADGPSTFTISGGTHVPWAPVFEFFEHSFLPQFRAMGGRARAELISHGFFPAAGGQIVLSVQPWTKPAAVDLTDRGEALDVSATAILCNVPPSVGTRELAALRAKVTMDEARADMREVDGPGGGNALLGFAHYANVTFTATAIGKRGVKAESVAKTVARSLRAYQSGEAFACEHLADQLLLPMAMVAADGQASAFTTSDVTEHTRTNADIIRAFLRVDIVMHQTDRKLWTIQVNPKPT